MERKKEIRGAVCSAIKGRNGVANPGQREEINFAEVRI